MFDSETPVQPKREKRKATVSAGEVGGSSAAMSEPGDRKKEEGTRWSILSIGGSGYIRFERMGRSLAIDLRERYRERRSAVLLARLGMGMW